MDEIKGTQGGQNNTDVQITQDDLVANIAAKDKQIADLNKRIDDLSTKNSVAENTTQEILKRLKSEKIEAMKVKEKEINPDDAIKALWG